MPNAVPIQQPVNANVRLRRAFFFARSSLEKAAEIERQLAAGYETRAVAESVSDAVRIIAAFTPDVAMVELAPDANSESVEVALVRRLRAEPQFFALPIVILFHEDARSLRNLALSFGADDYFSVNISADEIRARLDSLFWRAEAGRRAAPIVTDQHSEIDNFIALLDSIRADTSSGTVGTLALIETVMRGDIAAIARHETLMKAHGFFKLNLRRLDGVAFYGPTTLLVYLPRIATGAARANLTRLRAEFLNMRPEADIAIGLASFPSDANDIESLVEKAEAAVARARRPEARVRIVREDEGEQNVSSAIPETIGEARPKTATIVHSFVEPPAMIDQRSNTQTAPANVSPGIVNNSATFDHESAAIGADGGAIQSPLTADEAAARERDRRASGEAMPRRVLLTVSDAARLAQLNSLMRAAGYEVRAAFDGQQALDTLSIERPDLLLLDHNLRDMKGVEMLRRLREQPDEDSSLRVMMIVSAGDDAAAREAFRLGARNVVTMPCDPTEFLTMVRTAGAVE